MLWSIQVASAAAPSVYTEINDFVSFGVPFPAILTDQATATPRIQKLLNAAPAYTGKSYGEKTVTIKINVIPVPGDFNYTDFETKVNILRNIFQTRVDALFNLRLKRPGSPAMVVLATAKSFAVNQLERYVTVIITIPDSTWLSEAISKVTYNIVTSGQKLQPVSVGTVETYPLFIIGWNVPKSSLNPQGSFYKYQIPLSVTNTALTYMSQFPIDISGFIPAPAFTATAGTGGSIGASTNTIQVTAFRLSPSGATVETNALSSSVVVTASGSIAIVVNTYPDALGYNVYANNSKQNPGALTYTLMQPSAPIVTLTGGGGTGALAAAVVSAGVITNVVVVAGGSGYTSAPVVSITGGGGGTGALATAVVSAGVVTGFTLTAGGSGYSAALTASVSVTLTTLTTGGTTCPTLNKTGWDSAALVAAGTLKSNLSDVRVLVGGVAAPYTLVPPSGSNTCSQLWALFNLGTQETTNIYIQYGNSNPVAPPPYTDPTLPYPINFSPILNQEGSNNYQWNWTNFCDYQNTTRPGTWAPVQNLGVGYNWKQDNNIVRRGLQTSYAAASPLVNGTFANGTITGWTAGATGAVAATGNCCFGTFDTYACNMPAAGTFSQVVPVTPGLQYHIGGQLFSDAATNVTFSVVDGATTVFSYVGQGYGAYEDITFNVNTNILPVYTPVNTTVTVKVVIAVAGNNWLDDIVFYPDTDVVTRTPLTDPANDLTTCLGLLHSTVGINNLETPLNGWEISHPAGISSVTHWGVTSLVGSDYLNNNVLRLIATDATRPPAVIWGQPALTDGGAIAYATSGSPRVDAVTPSRARVRFEINASVVDANNGDGTFAVIQGCTIGINSQYGPSFVYSAVQSMYDLNATLTDTITGDSFTVTTPLEPQATITVDTQNHAVIYTGPPTTTVNPVTGVSTTTPGLQTNRPSALSLDSLRPMWMQLHPGTNSITYMEDVLGGVQVTVQWNDAWL